jgi:hypothetical protein
MTVGAYSPAQAGGGACVSINGTTRTPEGGSSICDSGQVGDRNRAIAVQDSTAIASGNNSGAQAVNDSVAVANGDNSRARATNDSVAAAGGEGSRARATNGDVVVEQ